MFIRFYTPFPERENRILLWSGDLVCHPFKADLRQDEQWKYCQSKKACVTSGEKVSLPFGMIHSDARKMNDIEQRLTLLANKVKEIIRRNEVLREENDRLHEELLQWQHRQEVRADVKHTTNEQIITSSTAKPLYIGDDKEVARKKIDDLVREIDFCLTLLDS